MIFCLTQAHDNGANKHVLSSPNCEPKGPLSSLTLSPEYLSPQSVIWHSISDEHLSSHDLMLRGKSKKESLWEQGWPCELITKVVAQDPYPSEDQYLPYALLWPLRNSFLVEKPRFHFVQGLTNSEVYKSSCCMVKRKRSLVKIK